MMISVVNQEEADRDIPKLIDLKRRFGIPWVGISGEPLLGLMDVWKYLPFLDWVIVGGESGHKDVDRAIQPLHPDWVNFLRDQCVAAGVAFFFKQWGEWEPATEDRGHIDGDMSRNGADWVHLDGLVNGPSWHRPDGRLDTDPFAMVRVGKKAAGALLDGRLHREFPSVTELHHAAA